MGAVIMVDQKRIKNRISGRNQAKCVADLACESIFLSDGTPEWDDGYGADYADSFIEALVKELKEKLPSRRQEPQPEESREPLCRLAASTIPFGKYAGQQFDEVPLEYLDWLCREQEGFYKKLREYLKHPDLNRTA